MFEIHQIFRLKKANFMFKSEKKKSSIRYKYLRRYEHLNANSNYTKTAVFIKRDIFFFKLQQLSGEGWAVEQIERKNLDKLRCEYFCESHSSHIDPKLTLHIRFLQLMHTTVQSGNLDGNT